MTTLAYVSHAGDGTLHALELLPQGRLVPRQRLALGGTLMPMALGPDGRTLYVARRSEPHAVLALAIDPGSGQLSLQGDAPLPASMAHLGVDPTGRWLLAASYPSDLLSVSALGACHWPESAHQVVAGVPHAHCLRLARGAGGALVTALGANELRSYRFDLARGLLDTTPDQVLKLPAGCGPRHIELHPRLDVAYVIGERDGWLHVVDLAAPGLRYRLGLDALPRPRPSRVWSADVVITPDGRFLYTSERSSSCITGFRIDAGDGMPTLIGHWSTQAQPRAMQVDPTGAHLLVAGQASHTLAAHAIGPDGHLDLPQVAAVGLQPSWVAVVKLAP